MKKLILLMCIIFVSLNIFAFEAIKPIAVSVDIYAGTILYWSGTNYAVAVATGTDTLTGTDTTLAYSLSQDDIVYGSVGYTSAATTSYTLVYSTGVLTYSASLTTAATAVVTYSYFVDTACTVDAILMEDVEAAQSPAYALIFLGGEIYETEIFNDDPWGLPSEDILARLARIGIYVLAVE